MPHVHLSEIELLELAEGELDASAAAACADCLHRLALLEAGRFALRASPVLELPSERLEAILASLPPQDREPGRLASLLHSPRRLALALAPVAAVVVAVVVGITIATSGDGRQVAGATASASTSAAAAMEAQAAPADGGAAEAAPEGGAADEASTAESPATASSEKLPRTGPFHVAGPAAEVARLLESAGFEVTVAGGTITVTGADPEAVARALDGRSTGGVEVVVASGD